MLFSWEPFDFGLREAQVRVARAEKSQAAVGRDVTVYEVSLAVVGAYLQVVANRQAVAAAQATVERMEVFANNVGVLVHNQLRPGADESRAVAELAQARIEWIRAREQAQIALATLAEKMGLAGASIQLQPGPLLGDQGDLRARRLALQLLNHPLFDRFFAFYPVPLYLLPDLISLVVEEIEAHPETDCPVSL